MVLSQYTESSTHILMMLSQAFCSIATKINYIRTHTLHINKENYLETKILDIDFLESKLVE